MLVDAYTVFGPNNATLWIPFFVRLSRYGLFSWKMMRTHCQMPNCMQNTVRVLHGV